MASQNMNRVAILPPGTPPVAVNTLRQAFVSLSKDEQFLTETMKIMRSHPRFDIGDDGERLRDKLLRAPVEVVDFVRQYVEDARK